MFKKSFIIIGIQGLSIFLGLVTIYLVAGNMAPEVYSLVGIYSIVGNLIHTFTHLGLETVMMREALYWEKNNEIEKTNEYTTQSIFSRVFGLLIISPLIVAYLAYLNLYKYDCLQTSLFIAFFFGGAVSSLNEAMTLIVRSQGGYVFAQTASMANSYIIKFLGLGFYFFYGDRVYLYFYGLSSIPLSIIYFIKLRKYFSFKYIDFKTMFNKIKESKFLWLKSYLDYAKMNADSLLVSAIFPLEIMGSYTIFKRLEQVSKSFIEGFFDVLSQDTVKYKGDYDKLILQEKTIKMAIYIIIAIIVVLTGIYWLNPEYFIKLIHLSKYTYIDVLLLNVSIVSICYLIGKYEINAIALFASSKFNFKFGIITFVITLISFLPMLIYANIATMIWQRILVYGLTSIFAIIYIKKNKKELYTEIKQ